MRKIVTAVVAGVVLAGCGSSPEGEVAEADFGDRWPLTVSEGTVGCRGSLHALVFTTRDGVTYALNGAAKGEGLPDIDAIHKADPDRQGKKVNLSALMEAAKKLCT